MQRLAIARLTREQLTKRGGRLGEASLLLESLTLRQLSVAGDAHLRFGPYPGRCEKRPCLRNSPVSCATRSDRSRPR